MLLAVEFNDYAAERKPLRVSWPKGHQRSTYLPQSPVSIQYSIADYPHNTILASILERVFCGGYLV